MSVILVGVPAFSAALRSMAAQVNVGASKAVLKGGHLIEAEAKRGLTKYSHSKGTVTPSPPGRPPAIVSGQLRRSIKVERPNRGKDGIWSTRTGPTAACGRIQELGGDTGRNHATRLPPRPFLAPAVEACVSSGRLQAVFDEAWRSVLVF